MKIQIEKELQKLYYIHIRYGGGNGWPSQKTFVRVAYKKKNGKLGSKYYCSDKYGALLFESYEEAKKFESKYNSEGDIKSLTLEDGALLKEVVVEGQKCLRLARRIY